MPAIKGHKKVGGRQKGSQNKATKDIKEAYRLLIETNIPNLTKWVKTIAEKDPAKAINILSELSEFVIPKLARTEMIADITQNTKITGFNFTDDSENKDNSNTKNSTKSTSN